MKKIFLGIVCLLGFCCGAHAQQNKSKVVVDVKKVAEKIKASQITLNTPEKAIAETGIENCSCLTLKYTNAEQRYWECSDGKNEEYVRVK